MLIAETWVEHVAKTLGMKSSKIRSLNFYKEGQLTHYNQKLNPHDATVQRCYDQVMNICSVESREKKIAKFNEKNRYKKRGIAVIPTKFGMSFTVKMLNQAGALVHVYKDGSVLVSHGGTEMGQGLHTKVIQVAAKALGVEMDKIHIAETATDKVKIQKKTNFFLNFMLGCKHKPNCSKCIF